MIDMMVYEIVQRNREERIEKMDELNGRRKPRGRGGVRQMWPAIIRSRRYGRVDEEMMTDREMRRMRIRVADHTDGVGVMGKRKKKYVVKIVKYIIIKSRIPAWCVL